ncbi:MAG: HDOD domain-containing protein [Candidatus Sumerlaeia bacterium]
MAVSESSEYKPLVPPGIRLLERDLPDFPEIAIRTLRLLQDPGVDNKNFARQLESDTYLHLAERILRVANSAFYSPRMPIRNVSDAISRLGRKPVYDLIVVAAVGELYDSNDPYIQELWNHAIATGTASLLLARRYDRDLANEAFMAGILHDIGKLVVYKKYPFLYWRYWCELGAGCCRLDKIEQAEFPDLAHTQIGMRVCQKWNLSDAIVDSANLHHKLHWHASVNRVAHFLPCVVSLASVIVNNMGINAPVCSWEKTETLACARFLGFELGHVGPIQDRLEELFSIHQLDIVRAPVDANAHVAVALSPPKPM